MHRNSTAAVDPARSRATLNFYAGATSAIDRLRVVLGIVRDRTDPRCDPHTPPLDRLFDRLARPELRAAKDGPGFVPARLREPYRLAEHVEAVTLLAYDIEAHGPADPQPPMPCEIADRCRALRWLACLYTTHSHEPPERIRYRLLLAIDQPLPPDAYRAAWHLPVRELGLLDWTDRSCRDPARLYYLPAVPPERAGLFEHHAVIGEPLRSATLVRVAATEHAERERIQRERIEAVRRRAGDPGRYGAAALASACERIATAAAGTRNNTLNAQAHGIAQLAAGGQVDEAVALDALAQAAERAGLEPAEVRATLRSAWRAGTRSPRAPEVRT